MGTLNHLYIMHHLQRGVIHLLDILLKCSLYRARYLLGLAVSYHRFDLISRREALASVTSTDLGLEQPETVTEHRTASKSS